MSLSGSYKVVSYVHLYQNYVPVRATILYLGPANGFLEQLSPRKGVGIWSDRNRKYSAEESASLCWYDSLDTVPQSLYEYILIDAEYIAQQGESITILFARIRIFCDEHTVVLVQRITCWGALWDRVGTYVQRRLLYALFSVNGYVCVTTQGCMAVGSIPYLSIGINGFMSLIPGLRHLGMRQLCVLRIHVVNVLARDRAVSVVIPCRNEEGTIEQMVQRIPQMGLLTELIFVEGHSRDGTLAALYRVQQKHPHLSITVCTQSGKGKANAVWEGCSRAAGDCIMIFDGDMTVLPEELPRFYDAFVMHGGDMVNGSRLSLPMEKGAMRWMNWLVNHTFGLLFSLLLGQKITDTLCGTKVFSRKLYVDMVRADSVWLRMDPFGDFTVLLGAAERGRKVIDMPVAYYARHYGSTQIQGFFRHGVILLRIYFYALLQRTFNMWK